MSRRHRGVMSAPSNDPRARVDSWILNKQIDYSLGQLRLVGVLLLLVLIGRLLVLLLTSPSVDLLNRLSALGALATWLPLLPLGISLYLLGGGRQRLPREFVPTTLLHRSLVPLALVCLLLLPALTLQSGIALSVERAEALAQQQERQSTHRQWLAEAEQATTAQQVHNLADRNQVSMPMMTGEPVELSRWRLDQALAKDMAAQLVQQPTLSLTPYQLELLSLQRILSTLLLQLIAGAGLLLLHRQGSHEIHRHGLSAPIFFRIDPVRSRHAPH